MKAFTRSCSRRFLALLFVALLGAGASPAASVGTGRSFKGPVGLQLYSLRAQFSNSVSDTLALVRSFGLKYVETAGTYGHSPKEFKALLRRHGLRAVAGHFPFEAYRTNLDGVVREAKALGLEYAGCAWIPHEGEFDLAECRDAIAVFNAAGKALARRGVKFFYHCHGYEFRPQGEGTFMDLLIRETDPRYVRFEMDVFWVAHPGQDPAAWLAKYPGRWELMHVKDMRAGTPTGSFTGHSDVNDNVVVGTGVLDWPAILRAAKRAGVKWYFLEDESDAAPEQIPQSLRFLERVAW
jgi:sugar phosphate isomerase/epimerase